MAWKRNPRHKSCLWFPVLTLTLDGHLNSLSLGFLTQESRYYPLSSPLRSCDHPPVHPVHPSIQHILIENQFHHRNCAGHRGRLLTGSQPQERASSGSVEIKTASVHRGSVWTGADLATFYPLLFLNLTTTLPG